jgi:two-component system chemotaxis response regulator CheB
LTPKNSENALKALDLGAIEVLCKPGAAYSTQDISRPLARAIRAAASARIDLNQIESKSIMEKVDYDTVLKETTHKVIAIGASTGGTKAIETVLKEY